MLKKILLFAFIIASTYTFSQKNEIEIYPLPINTWSVIKISTVEKGIHELHIIDNENKLLFNKKILVEGKNGFKHNFKNYKKGNYTISVFKKNRLIFSESFTKK